MHGGVVCIFETHWKEEEVIDGEHGFGLPGLRQTIVHLVSQSALQMWTHPSDKSRFLNQSDSNSKQVQVCEINIITQER